MSKESGIDSNFVGPSNAVITDINPPIPLTGLGLPNNTAYLIIRTNVAGPSQAPTRISDPENDSSSAGPPAKIPAREKRLIKKTKKQAFREAWLQNPMFKSWLEPTEDPYKVKCRVCSKFFTARKTQLIHHANTVTHNMNMDHSGAPLTSAAQPARNFSDSIKVAEIRYCIDIIEHNRSVNSFKLIKEMPHMAPLDPNILSHMSLKPRKISAIIQNVVNKSVILETTAMLHGKLFSILIDETTEVSNTKIVWFLIRYIHDETMYTYLLDLIRLKECTAENLHKCLLHSLKTHDLPVSNIVGVCADNTDVMLGRQNSLISCLLADNEEISVFPCICHSMNVVASQACKHLPSHIEEFLDSVYTYFSRSPKLQGVSEGMQDFINFANQKLLQSPRTRWLALTECVKRISNQWQDLFAIFAEAKTKGKSKVASKIFHYFNCPYTKAYVQFLNYVLNTFTGISGLFQSSVVLLHCLLPECWTMLRLLGGNFIKTEYMGALNLHEIDVYNEASLVPLRTIYIGAESMSTINEIINSNLEDEKIMEFYTNIKQFYQSAFENIVKRLPFNEKFLNSLDFLTPRIALDITSHRNDHLNCILSKFKSKFNCTDVLDEWRLLPFYFSNEEKGNLELLAIPQFWHQISNTNDISGKYMFKNISKLAQLCLTLPLSNADVEGFYSNVTGVKTKLRNKLEPQMIAALTRVKLHLNSKNLNASNYEITDKMLSLFNSRMYAHDCIPEELAGILFPDSTDESDNETGDNN